MTLYCSGLVPALAATLLTFAACVDRAPITDTAAPLSARALDFVVPTTVDLGAAPTAVVVADLDGDGHPDLAAATGASGVAVSLARDGGFAPPRAYPAGNASGLVAGDLDGDGKIDLVVINEVGVGVLLGKGDGSFGAARSFNAGGPPAAIVAGDFDRDGKLDVAVEVDAGGRVVVLLGEGDGSFKPAASYDALPGATLLVAGDVDGDGKIDLVVATSDGRVATLFGDGDGTLRSGATGTLGRERDVHAIAAGDFNGDGKLDLAIAWSWSFPDHFGAVDVALGNGDGSFRWTGSTGGFNRSGPSAVAVVDLDGDGKLDLVADIAHGRVVVTALGKGDGSLGAIAYHRAAGALVAAADLDSDGKADVVAASGNGVVVSAGNGDGTLRAPRAFEVGGDAGGLTGRVAVGDFNRDGFDDVAVTYYDTTIAHVDVLVGDSRGDLHRAWSYGLTRTSADAEIAAVDLDGDGVLDLVSADELPVLLGNGDGTFREAYFDPHVNANALAIGDFDGDGKLDAALYRIGRPGLTIMPGKGDGTFAKDRQTSVAVDGGVTAVAAADLDGDGRTDLAVGAGGSLLVLLGKGDGTFAPPRPVVGVATATAVAAADLDGDRRIDLVVAHAGEEASTVLLNAGGGAFRPAGTVPSSGRLRVADVDSDGTPDLLVQGNALVVYRGKGDGTFEVGRVCGAGGSDFAVGDVDGDGRPDVVVALGGISPFASVLRNASR